MQKHLEYDKNCNSKHRNARKKCNERKSYLPRLVLFHPFQGRKSCVREDLQSGIKLSLFSSQLAETSLNPSKIFQCKKPNVLRNPHTAQGKVTKHVKTLQKILTFTAQRQKSRNGVLARVARSMVSANQR